VAIVPVSGCCEKGLGNHFTDDKSSFLLLLQFLAQVADLLLKALAGVFLWVNCHQFPWARWAILGPNQVDQILLNADERRAAFVEALVKFPGASCII
jgi:hypothetical protein